jgi:4-amino-4-deoxy-L-arabinose transferase-like glycosyltransferase
VNSIEQKQEFGIAAKYRKYLFLPAALLLFGLFAIQLLFHAARASTTVDESPHILAGHRYWQCGDFGINPEHPPLLKLLAAAPLNFRGLKEPNRDCGSRMTSKGESFIAGRKFLSDNGVDEIVFPARVSAMLVSLLLAVVVFLAAREMFGRGTALTALSLLAFEPNLIAHGSLVTTDMALTATAFAAVYALYRFLNDQNAFRFLIAGLTVGLMLAAKHSAVLFLPVLFALFVADAFFRRSEASLTKQIFRNTSAFAGIFLVGLILLWAFYGFRYYAIPSATENTISVENYIKEKSSPKMAESFAAKAVSNISRTRILPESYVLGLADILAWSSRSAFIFNRAYTTGQWFYFPLAFIVKTSIPLLLLLPFGLLMPFFQKEKRREMMFLLAPPLFFFAVSLTWKLNLGVRHILPVYAFFIIAAAAGAVAISQRFKPFRYVLILLLLFHAATASRIAPNYIAFSNDFWGGVNNTYRVFPGDSNTEFGQNDKLVAEYVAHENIKDCWYAPFDTTIDILPADFPCRYIATASAGSTERLFEPVPPIIEGTILLSTTVLPPRAEEFLPIAQSVAPIAQIGGSVFVYRGRFEIPQAAAWSLSARVEQLIYLKRFEEAFTDARKAVELAPTSPYSHFALGLALENLGRKEEARQAFETEIKLMQLSP